MDLLIKLNNMSVPTRKEFLEQNNYPDSLSGGTLLCALREFAELHVTQALKEASENVDTEILCQHGYGIVDKESILNVYPLDLIK